MLIEKASGSKSGIYLEFNISISNIGLKESRKSALNVYVNQEKVQSYDLGNIDIGTKKSLSVQNLKIPRESESIMFAVNTDELELDKLNNQAEITFKSS